MTRASVDAWASLFGSDPLVVDGGLSTQLERIGQDIAGQLWTGRVLLENPAAVTRAHTQFIAAGAGVVITASYQVSRRGFIEAGMTSADADAALRASVAAAREAVAPKQAIGASVRVAASVGPYGAILHDGSEYRGDYGLSRAELVDFHRERIEVLADAMPDLLAVETIPDVREAEAVVDALGQTADLPAWMVFTAMDGERLWAGQPIEEAVLAAASAPSVIGVGVNCTDPRHVTELVTRIGAVVDLPIIIYPNAGGRWDASTGQWRGVAPEGAAFPAAVIAEWYGAGAVAIGGCCGTDDRSIRMIADVLGSTPA